MEILAQFIDKIQNTGIFFWLGAIAGIGLIFIVRFGLRKFFKKKIKRERTRLF